MQQECHLLTPPFGEEAWNRARWENPKGDKDGELPATTPCRAGSFLKGNMGFLLKAQGLRDSNTFPIRERTMSVLGFCFGSRAIKEQAYLMKSFKPAGDPKQIEKGGVAMWFRGLLSLHMLPTSTQACS